MWPRVALFIPFYVRISGESVKPGMITAPVIHVPGNIRAYRVLVTANKALVGHFMPGTSVTWKPVPSSWVYFVNSYLKGDKMAKSCDYEAIRVFISVNVGKDTNNAITVNYSDSVCATRHYHSTKINSGG